VLGSKCTSSKDTLNGYGNIFFRDKRRLRIYLLLNHKDLDNMPPKVELYTKSGV
jgi:hypothetical protein